MTDNGVNRLPYSGAYPFRVTLAGGFRRGSSTGTFSRGFPLSGDYTTTTRPGPRVSISLDLLYT